MNESRKVQPHHLERNAYLYIRQSSMRQVRAVSVFDGPIITISD